MSRLILLICVLCSRPLAVLGQNGSEGSAARSAVDAAADERILHIQPRYYRWHVDPGEEWLEKKTGYARLDWKIPLSQTALVLVDVWDRHYLKEPEERAERIIQAKIRPLVATCRKAGMRIIHAPSPRQAEQCAAWVGREKQKEEPTRGSATVAKPAASEPWPPAQFRGKTGRYQQYARPREPMAADRARILEGKCMHPDVRPQGSDVVVATGRELHEFCQKGRILFLFYLGFNTNMCVLQRDYGTMAMYDRGYEIIVLRNCTTGMESFETQDGLWQTRGAILFLEMNRKYSLLSEELVAGLSE